MLISGTFSIDGFSAPITPGRPPFQYYVSGPLPAGLQLYRSRDAGANWLPIILEGVTLYEIAAPSTGDIDGGPEGVQWRFQWTGTAAGEWAFVQ